MMCFASSLHLYMGGAVDINIWILYCRYQHLEKKRHLELSNPSLACTHGDLEPGLVALLTSLLPCLLLTSH